MRPLVILTLLASLLLVSTASAKELAGATVCGADDCRTVGAGGELDRMLLEGSAAAAPEPAPFLRVSLRFRGEEDEIVIAESLLVPSAGAGDWDTNGHRTFISTNAGASRFVIHSMGTQTQVQCPTASAHLTLYGPTVLDTATTGLAQLTPAFGGSCTRATQPDAKSDAPCGSTPCRSRRSKWSTMRWSPTSSSSGRSSEASGT